MTKDQLLNLPVNDNPSEPGYYQLSRKLTIKEQLDKGLTKVRVLHKIDTNSASLIYVDVNG